MKRIGMMVLVCALSIGVGVALAQSNSGASTPAGQGQVSGASGAASGQSGNQPPVTDQNQRPRSQPAGSNAQANQTNQTGPGNVQNTKTERGAGGVSVVWLLVGIVVVIGILYVVARGGGRDREANAVRTRRADQIDRVNNDRNRAA